LRTAAALRWIAQPDLVCGDFQLGTKVCWFPKTKDAVCVIGLNFLGFPCFDLFKVGYNPRDSQHCFLQVVQL
jgi:hypothetical protein